MWPGDPERENRKKPRENLILRKRKGVSASFEERCQELI